MNTIVYNAFDNIYINLTNRCSNRCDFCIRSGKEGVYGVDNLWLDNEPTSVEVIDALKKNSQLASCKEVVFCGFGEPTYKINEITEVCKFLKQIKKHTRINTNGQGNLIHGGSIAKELGAIDTINFSLNSSTAKGYQDICHSDYGEQGFCSMIELAKECKALGGNVIFSVVDSIGREEILACKKLCQELGIPLRIREYEA